MDCFSFSFKALVTIIRGIFAVVAIGLPFVGGIDAAQAAEAAALAPPGSSMSERVVPDDIAQRRAEQEHERKMVAFDPKQFDKFVGFYQLNSCVFVTVFRTGARFFARLTGQNDVEFFPESSTKFFAKVVHAQISFENDSLGNVGELLLHQNGRVQEAPRIDAATVKAFELAIQKHISEGKADPDREALARRDILSQQEGKPEYEIMSPSLVAVSKEQWPQIQEWNRRIGKFENLLFLHVSQQGWDVYDVTYEHGHMIMSVGPLTPDHKLQGIRYEAS